MSLTVSIDPIFWLLCRHRLRRAGSHDAGISSPSGLPWAVPPPCSAALLVAVLPGAGGGVHRRQHPLPAGPQAPVLPGCAKPPTATNGDRALGREAVGADPRLR